MEKQCRQICCGLPLAMQRFQVGSEVVASLRVEEAGDDVGGIKVPCARPPPGDEGVEKVREVSKGKALLHCTEWFVIYF